MKYLPRLLRRPIETAVGLPATACDVRPNRGTHPRSVWFVQWHSSQQLPWYSKEGFAFGMQSWFAACWALLPRC
jgi:hypothetical protein